MDFRKEAEARAARVERRHSLDRRDSYRLQQDRESARRQSIKDELLVNETDFMSEVNETPRIAHLAQLDYKWNGSRARANSGEFVIPRWVPDEEVAYCRTCNAEFDLVSRRHHCRHCGMVFCEPCSLHQLLLPREFGYRDPVRVCNACYAQLLPYQDNLSSNIANHQRLNNVDVASTNCNMRRYMNLPFSSTLGAEIRKAAYSVHNLFGAEALFVADKAIPLRLLASARGLAFITVVKGGFIFAPRLGTGLVMARLADGGWSAPSAIGTLGLSWGAIIGLDVTDYVLILNTDEAVEAFSGAGQITIGVGMEVAVGPVGRSGSADYHISDTGAAPAFSYSQSRGLFAGLSLDGSVILARNDVNHRFYGRVVTPADLLSGRVAPPRNAAPLYDALSDALASLPDVQHLRPARTLLSPPRSSFSPVAELEGQNQDSNAGNPEADSSASVIGDISALLKDSEYDISASSSAERAAAAAGVGAGAGQASKGADGTSSQTGRCVPGRQKEVTEDVEHMKAQMEHMLL